MKHLIHVIKELLPIIENDLWSYGFGGRYNELGKLAAALYLAVEAVQPGSIDISGYPKIRSFVVSYKA